MGNGLNFILLAATAYWVFVSVMVVLSVRKMSHPEPLLEAVEDEARLNDIQGISNWAGEQGFVLDKQFDFRGMVGNDLRMAVDAWASLDRKLFFMHYAFKDKHWYEFVSNLDEKYSLTSSSFKDSLTLPFPPRALVQVFEGMPPGELLEQHNKTLRFFKEQFEVEPAIADKPMYNLLVDAIKDQMQHVKSLPFWYLKGAWWYFYRRNRLKNRSIIDLIQTTNRDQ